MRSCYFSFREIGGGVGAVGVAVMNVVLGDWVVTIFTQDPTIFVAFVAEVFFCCVFVCWPVTRWFEFKDRVVVLVRFAAVVALCDGDFTCAHVFSAR